MRTLIVDDECIGRGIVLAMVRAYGEAEAVGSGADALLAFCMAHDESRPFDLVLLDIEMPVMDGHQTLKRLRDEEASRGIAGLHAAAVVMTTGCADHGRVFSAFREQAEGYLIKPVRPEHLHRELVTLGLIAG